MCGVFLLNGDCERFEADEINIDCCAGGFGVEDDAAATGT